ncbi:hypothetical protein ACWGH2_41965 [Streptomyces sp. NPDC054871]
MSATTVEVAPRDLVAVLRLPVWNVLAERADELRRALPPRPESPEERLRWLQSLSLDQQRRAALLDHLDALCGHIAGRPAPGYSPDDPMPDAALQAAEGFNPQLSKLITNYRAARQQSR